MPLVPLGILIFIHVAQLESRAVGEMPGAFPRVVITSKQGIDLTGLLDDFFELVIGAPKEDPAGMSPVFMRMLGPVAQDPARLAPAFGATIEDLFIRTQQEDGLRTRLRLPGNAKLTGQRRHVA